MNKYRLAESKFHAADTGALAILPDVPDQFGHPGEAAGFRF
ncbi:hypothetical protein ALO_05955 [Acetonema longum DSM 6540]|uniref:Uncharacterized protein n=1 Tax=Acetonema longum DSM 6540 TaxID=1009370 RepID=F7NGK3_9FIRM|nr:hypothetical protein ALO_05955 [Acetonema longum DSM 6540]